MTLENRLSRSIAFWLCVDGAALAYQAGEVPLFTLIVRGVK